MEIKFLRLIMILSKYAIYSIIIQFIGYNILLANNTLGQKKQPLKKIYVAIDAFEDTPLERVFITLESKTNFIFHYDKKDLSGQTLTMPRTTSKVSLHDYLVKVSERANLRFKRINENIHVNLRAKKKNAWSRKSYSNQWFRTGLFPEGNRRKWGRVAWCQYIGKGYKQWNCH